MKSFAMRVTLSALVVCALSAPASQGATIAQWTYESADPPDIMDNTTGPSTSADVGTGTATSMHVSNLTDWSNPTGNGSLRAQSSNNWAVGDWYQFQVSTVGSQNLMIDWDQTRSATGPPSFKLQYSTDGTNFTDSTTYSVLESNVANGGTWNTTTLIPNYHTTIDLSTVDALEGLPAVYFRLTATGIGTSVNGTNRVDNFTVSDDSPVVPEPSSIALSLFLVMTILGVMRHSSR